MKSVILNSADSSLGEAPAAAPQANRKRALADRIFAAITFAGAAVVLLLALLLVAVLVSKAWLSITTFGFPFLYSAVWDPEPTHRQFGAAAFIYGTLATSGIAMLIAVPLGIASAAYLSELSPKIVNRVGSFLIEMLAAIPSVVYGFWALFIFAPWFQKIIKSFGGPNQGGIGILTAGIVLAIMILPYIASVSYDMLRAVPRSQREGCLAMGATRWQMIRDVLLPYARPGIIGGCFLALGRALGETMAVTMLIGNRSEINWSIFGVGNSIASVIANEFAESTYDLYTSALVQLGLILFLLSMAVNGLARLMIRKTTQRAPSRIRAKKITTGRKESGVAFDPTRTEMAHRRNRIIHRLMSCCLGLCFFVAVTPLFLILGYLVARGVTSLNIDFFMELPAPVGEKGGGMANALVGSFILVGLATMMSVPVGLLAALYVVEFRKTKLASIVRFVGELLGGVPSIVVGIFAYTILVRPMGHFSGWAGGFALAVMMIPIILRAGEEALRLVPTSLKEGSYALGANRLQTAFRVTVPAALPALITAVFLAIARVAGETAPLLLTASSNQFWPTSPNDFMPSLPVYIFNYAVSPYKDWHRQAWAAALVLLLAVMILNFGIRAVTRKGGRFRTSAD